MAGQCMNKLYVGLSKTIDLPKGSFLLIHDKGPCIRSQRVRPVQRQLRASAGYGQESGPRFGEKPLHRLSGSSVYSDGTQWAAGPRAGLSQAKRLNEIRIESKTKGVKEEVEEMLAKLLFTDVMQSVLCSDND